MKKILLLITIISCFTQVRAQTTYGSNLDETVEWLNKHLSNDTYISYYNNSRFSDYYCRLDYNGKINISYVIDKDKLDFASLKIKANLRDLEGVWQEGNKVQLKFSTNAVVHQVIDFSTVKSSNYFSVIHFEVTSEALAIKITEAVLQLINLKNNNEFTSSETTYFPGDIRSYVYKRSAIKKLIYYSLDESTIKLNDLGHGSQIAKSAFESAIKNITDDQEVIEDIHVANVDELKPYEKYLIEAIIHDPKLLFLDELDREGEAYKKIIRKLLNAKFCNPEDDLLYDLILFTLNKNSDRLMQAHRYLLYGYERVDSKYSKEKVALANRILDKSKHDCLSPFKDGYRLFYNRSYAYFILNQPEKGLNELNTAFELYPEYRSYCLVQRGRYYNYELKMPDKAAEDYNAARAIYVEKGDEQGVKHVDFQIKYLRSN